MEIEKFLAPLSRQCGTKNRENKKKTTRISRSVQSYSAIQSGFL